MIIMSFKHIFTPLLISKKCPLQLIRNLNSTIINSQVTQTSFKTDYEILPCRTKEDNPSKQSLEHHGLYYTVPQETANIIYGTKGLPLSYMKQCDTFVETTIMVRRPALELFHYFKQMDDKKPSVRFLLYGPYGTGKSLTLAHCLHWAFNNEYLIVHIPWAREWIRRCKEVANSVKKPDFVDLPIDASIWLNHFKKQNEHLLNKLQLRTLKEYTWSEREITPKDAPLINIVNLGMTRVRFACEIIDVLIDEIKQHSTEGRVKTFVGIDGYSAFFEEKTNIKNELKKEISAEKISLIDSFKKLTRNDWPNGCMVLIIDSKTLHLNSRTSDLPIYCLGKKGFEHVDPFVPIRVDNFTEKEFHSCINYYLDRLWIQNKYAVSEESRNELLALTLGNPEKIMKVCAPL